ncbi:MAG: enoyl-CoA hydratase-related protein [Dehalococcoidia bacterium]
MPGYEHILYDVHDGIATVTMNRPEAINGMTTRMLGETHDALIQASRDSSVKVLVLTGAGNLFKQGWPAAEST